MAWLRFDAERSWERLMRKKSRALASSIGRLAAVRSEAKGRSLEAHGKVILMLLVAIALFMNRFSGDWFPLAGERQSYAAPQFETLAFVIRSANVEMAHSILSARSALPHAQQEKFTDRSSSVMQNQIKELNAFVELNQFSGRVGSYLQTIVKDLVDQRDIGVVSASEFGEIKLRIDNIAETADIQKQCVEQARSRVAVLAAGPIPDKEKEVAALVESTRDMLSRIKGKDIVTRCFIYADRIMNDAASIVYFHDVHVMPFNQRAARNMRWRETANLPLVLAMFFLGGFVKDYVPQVLGKLFHPLRKKYGRRFYRFGTKEVLDWPKRRLRKSFWH